MDDEETRDVDDHEAEVPDADDAEGQVLTWKLKQPNTPEAGEDDTEGQSIPPRPERRSPDIPLLEEDDTEGHGIGGVGSPLPPVD